MSELDVILDPNNFSWIKVKKYTRDVTLTLDQQYDALEKHHIAETTFLLDKCRELAKQAKGITGMGLGMLGSTTTTRHCRFRWGFVGEDEARNTIFSSFVKIVQRLVPESISFESAGEFNMTQYFTFCDGASGAARQQFDLVNESVPHIVSGKLMLYDGGGTILEKWELTGVALRLEPTSDLSSPDHIIANWLVSYEKAVYKSCSQS